MKNAQATIEYLILLSVILMLALVSVNLTFQFFDLGQDTQIKSSKEYYANQKTVAIIDGGINRDGNLELALKNNLDYRIKIDMNHSIMLDDTYLELDQNYFIPEYSTVIVRGVVPNFDQTNNFSKKITITYFIDGTDLNAITIGKKELILKVQ
ncbi:MAG: hypothetical protein PHQ98_03830 [Candidatus ainarchaeum sp.]|nr:hypothetical protein [Candidatus ainarchaeum sp.]